MREIEIKIDKICKEYLASFYEANADVEQIIKQHPDIAPDPADVFEYHFILSSSY